MTGTILVYRAVTITLTRAAKRRPTPIRSRIAERWSPLTRTGTAISERDMMRP